MRISYTRTEGDVTETATLDDVTLIGPPPDLRTALIGLKRAITHTWPNRRVEPEEPGDAITEDWGEPNPFTRAAYNEGIEIAANVLEAQCAARAMGQDPMPLAEIARFIRVHKKPVPRPEGEVLKKHPRPAPVGDPLDKGV